MKRKTVETALRGIGNCFCGWGDVYSPWGSYCANVFAVLLTKNRHFEAKQDAAKARILLKRSARHGASMARTNRPYVAIHKEHNEKPNNR